MRGIPLEFVLKNPFALRPLCPMVAAGLIFPLLVVVVVVVVAPFLFFGSEEDASSKEFDMDNSNPPKLEYANAALDRSFSSKKNSDKLISFSLRRMISSMASEVALSSCN